MAIPTKFNPSSLPSKSLGSSPIDNSARRDIGSSLSSRSEAEQPDMCKRYFGHNFKDAKKIIDNIQT